MTQITLTSCCSRFDFVELADSSGRRIGDRLSGSNSGFGITAGGDRTRFLNVRFTSDSSNVRKGFFAQYITFGE